MSQLSQFDLYAYQEIRKNVERVIVEALRRPELESARILDIAPQVHAGVEAKASSNQIVETLDLSDKYHPTFVGDICTTNHLIQNDTYDAVFLLEVIEHVLEPFGAMREIMRILKPGGMLFATSPFNFRIHGPLPDCWRISEHGWRQLLSKFCEVTISPLEDNSRFLMPIHYSVSARKPTISSGH
jgi:2-polyprenyl-3-methyl-5-hydroxy-6-metoxy-1,4-benzoquinol methylase